MAFALTMTVTGPLDAPVLTLLDTTQGENITLLSPQAFVAQLAPTGRLLDPALLPVTEPGFGYVFRRRRGPRARAR
jgi:hypothetical protein